MSNQNTITINGAARVSLEGIGALIADQAPNLNIELSDEFVTNFALVFTRLILSPEFMAIGGAQAALGVAFAAAKE